jgi:hypothetical protein
VERLLTQPLGVMLAAALAAVVYYYFERDRF